MIGQDKRLILVVAGISAAWSFPAHAQTTREGASTQAEAPGDASSEPKPVGNPGQWFGPDTYPPEAKRNREQGTVRVGVVVDADGMPTGCSILESSGSSALDEGTCPIFLEHVRFRPGTDNAGRAAPSMWRGSVTWRLDEQDSAIELATTGEVDRTVPAPLGNPAEWFPPAAYPTEAKRAGEEGTVGFAVDVDAHGRIISCRITQSSGSPSLDTQTCALIRKSGKFAPARDPSGNAVAGTWQQRTTWTLGNKPIDVASALLRWSATTQYTLDERGNAIDCTSISVEGGIVNPCLQFVPGVHMGLALSEDGVPVRSRLTLTVSSKIEPLPPPQK